MSDYAGVVGGTIAGPFPGVITNLTVSNDATVTDALDVGGTVTLTGTNALEVVGSGAGSPVIRMRKAATGTDTIEFYSDQSGTQIIRADLCLTASEDLALRVYSGAGALVATWTFFSDGDSQNPGTVLLGAAAVRMRADASATPVGAVGAQPTSMHWQRDSGRRWFKKSGTSTTGWHPEVQLPPQIQTTDATVTTIVTYPMQDNSAIFITADVTAKTNAVAGCKAIKMVGLARRSAAGGVVIVGTPVDLTGGLLTDAAITTAVVTITASSNDVLVRVTGVAATTINWNAVVTFSESRDTV